MPRELTSESKNTQYKNKLNTLTHAGVRLTAREAKFIDCYVATGIGSKSVVEAGYRSKNPEQYAQTLLSKQHIADEIQYRLDQHKSDSIAEADEIMRYFTGVMRGEIKDQFGLDAPLGERTKAAQELAKRKIDIPNKLAGNGQTAEVRITLDWGTAGETPSEE